MTTPRQLITGALRLLNVVQANEVPTAEDMDISLEAFNGMLDSWSNEKLSIYTMDPYFFPFEGGKKEYTLGPGADWEIDRPMDVVSGYVRLSRMEEVFPPSGCNYVQSVLDGDTMSLWHFDEEAAPAVNAVPGFSFTNDYPTNWTFFPNFGLCAGSILLPAVDTANQYQQAFQDVGDEAPRQQTFEFAVRNPGGHTTDFEKFGLTDVVTYAFGEATATMAFQLIDGLSGPTVFRFWNANGSAVLIDVPLPLDTWVVLAWEVDLDALTFSIYANGTRVYNELLKVAFPELTPWNEFLAKSHVLFDEGSGLYVDEFRQSSVIRYNGDYSITL